MSYQDEAIRQAAKYGVNPDLFARLVNQESGWNPNAVSSVGARGLTQIMPATGRDPGFGVKPVNMGDTTDQLRFGAEYLSKMLARYDGNEDKALAAYNWGAGNADKWSGDLDHLPAETRNYVNTISGYKGSRAGINAEQSGLVDRAQSNNGGWEQRQSSEQEQAGLDQPPEDLWEYSAPALGGGAHEKIYDWFGGDEKAGKKMASLGGGLQDIGQRILAGGF